MELKAVYSSTTLLKAIVLVTFGLNLIVSLTCFLFAGLFMNVNEGHQIGCLAIYFICSYEFLFNILRFVA